MEIEKKPSASVRPGLVTGALVAAMLTASLISVFYLAWKVAGLPFVPFDVFDWMTRILPGQVLAVGIGAMVTVIRALNLGPTAAAAKAAEHAMAIAGMFFTGIIRRDDSLQHYTGVTRAICAHLGACLGNRHGCPG